MIVRGKHGVLRPELLHDIHRISNSIQSMVAMINNFLELARLEGVGSQLNLERLELNEVLTSTCEEFRPLLEVGQLDWVCHPECKPAWVEGDRQRLTQVISNLFGNAIKFTPPGGKIRTRVSCADREVEVEIEDTGPGIDPKLLPRLFERYSRVEDQKVAGTGLGLMIVKEIVAAHGGMVGARSEVGQGSTFWFRLPLLGVDGAGAGARPRLKC
jgi:signal transduction histidine kinase